ncbi:NfeD family protein [Sphingopyxis sp. LK2115]|jgi:membrane protein implicated in regulation of membrane protease activity|uniref:NfeD family protein n=1 Tax=Sphingopyxis sp. LK2115 TaxID=2744558 RepID=UPI0016606FBF|nr:NfeD family protein [Sphingopyxis sp. LK2115]
MPDWLTNMEPHWAWLSLGVLLAAAEIVAPGFFLIWIGAAAVVTGVVAWIVPLSVPLQLGIFALLSFVALYGGRRWLKANPITTADPNLNQRGSRLVGEVLTVTKAIEDGRGRAKVGDGEWPVRGPDAAEGAKVRVVSADGGVLVVELA